MSTTDANAGGQGNTSGATTTATTPATSDASAAPMQTTAPPERRGPDLGWLGLIGLAGLLGLRKRPATYAAAATPNDRAGVGR